MKCVFRRIETNDVRVRKFKNKPTKAAENTLKSGAGSCE
jgi:hypothetical protein